MFASAVPYAAVDCALAIQRECRLPMTQVAGAPGDGRGNRKDIGTSDPTASRKQFVGGTRRVWDYTGRE